MERIEFDGDELDAANNWHGGQSSMLYAIASTGALSRGTIRPVGDDGHPMMDAQWLAHLAERLEGEASDAADKAHNETLDDERDALESIAAKCRAAIAVLTPEAV